MDIENLKARVYFLAGQLEEAKKFLQEAAHEITEANNKQAEADKLKQVQPES